ncbi:MAG TPA: hypothetical protein VIW24_14475 [Aldersonia sp.]
MTTDVEISYQDVLAWARALYLSESSRDGLGWMRRVAYAPSQDGYTVDEVYRCAWGAVSHARPGRHPADVRREVRTLLASWEADIVAARRAARQRLQTDALIPR